jgi:hypothetical protein
VVSDGEEGAGIKIVTHLKILSFMHKMLFELHSLQQEHRMYQES